MLCGVCETRRDDDAAKFCVKCAKLMCDECAQHHDHVFGQSAPGQSRDHAVKDLGKIRQYFETEARNYAAKQSGENDFICELCDDESCPRCVARRKRERQINKVKKYTPQIQSALTGCQKMIDSKESLLGQMLNDVGGQENEISKEMKRVDDMIHQATNEILFRIATALRKRESQIKKNVKAPYYDHLQRCRGVAENARSFLQVLERARDVVAEQQSSDSVPMDKDLFTHLGVINKFDVSLLRGNTRLHRRLPSTQCVIPSDKEVNNVCELLLRADPDRHTATNPQRKRFSPQGDADDEMSIGETDEDFGEFHVIGNPQQVNRVWKPRVDTHPWSHAPRSSAPHQLAGGGKERREEAKHSHRSQHKSLRDDMLHGKDISTKANGQTTSDAHSVNSRSSTQRTDSGTTCSSGHSHKSTKSTKSSNHVRRKKHADNEVHSVRSNSHSELYKATHPSYPTETSSIDDLRSKSTGNLTLKASADETPRINKHRKPRDQRSGDVAAAKQDRPKRDRSSPEKRHKNNPIADNNPSLNPVTLKTPTPKPRKKQVAENENSTHASSVQDVKWRHNAHLPSFVYFSDVNPNVEATNGNGMGRRLSYVPRTLLTEFDERRNRKKSFPLHNRPSRPEPSRFVQSGPTGRMLDNPALLSTPL